MKTALRYIALFILFVLMCQACSQQNKKKIDDSNLDELLELAEQKGENVTDQSNGISLDSTAPDNQLTLQEVHDSLTSLFVANNLPGEIKRVRDNISTMSLLAEHVSVKLIMYDEEHIRDFKTYAMNSPWVVLSKVTGYYPQGVVCRDTNMFVMKVSPNVYPDTVSQIEISISNRTSEEAMAGTDYYVEYYNGIQWDWLPQGGIFTALGLPVSPKQTRDGFTACLDPHIHKNKPGHYRVTKTISTMDIRKNYVLTASFYLSDKPDEYKEYTTFVNNLYTPRAVPEFKGGREAMAKFLEARIIYPDSLKGKEREGRVFCSFTVDSKGKITNLKAVNTKAHPAFNDEALRVLRLMPRWNPAVDRIHGPVAVDYGVGFYFKDDKVEVR